MKINCMCEQKLIENVSQLLKASAPYSQIFYAWRVVNRHFKAGSVKVTRASEPHVLLVNQQVWCGSSKCTGTYLIEGICWCKNAS